MSNFVTKITTQNYKEGSLEAFADRESEALDIPYEFIKDAVYTQPKGNKHLYFGAGQVSILAVLAEKHGCGILDFSEPKFKMLDLKLLIESQEKIRADILSSKNDDNSMVENYHRLGINYILPEKDAISDLENFGKSFVFFRKTKPAIHSCVLEYEVFGGICAGKRGSVEYVVDYALTKVNSGVGASLHIIPTMITRAKKLAYEKAFGGSPGFFIKACKIDLYSEYRQDNVFEAKENTTSTKAPHAQEVSADECEKQHEQKLASIDDLDWQSLPTEINTDQ
jgi:hypothetical protein